METATHIWFRDFDRSDFASNSAKIWGEGQLHPPPSFLGSAGPSNNYCDGFFNFLSIFSLKLTAALDIPNQQFNSCTKIDSTFFPTIAAKGQWALTRATLSRTAPKVFTKLQIYVEKLPKNYQIIMLRDYMTLNQFQLWFCNKCKGFFYL